MNLQHEEATIGNEAREVSPERKQADAIARGIIMAVLFIVIAVLAIIVWYSKIGPVKP